MVRSKEVLNSFAKNASDAFLGKSKVALNDSLMKIAKAEALEPHQVEYIASQANHNVWSSLFGIEKKASYDFPLADAGEVIEKLQIKAAPVIKEASLDYMTPPKKFVYEKTASGTVCDDSVDTKKAKRRGVKHELEHRLQKAALAKNDLSCRMIEIQSQIESLDEVVVKEARDLVIKTPFTQRVEAIEKIAEFVRGSINGDATTGLRLMKKIAGAIKKAGLVKEADLKAPAQYINENLPARIVNGRHVLYVTIQTIRDKSSDYENCQRVHEIVDSSLPVIREKIRAL